MIILTSNGLSSDILMEKVKGLLKKAKTAVVITTASEYKEKDWHIPRIKGELESLGLAVEFFDFDCNDTGQLLKFDVVEILGGNPFYLLNAMKKSNCRDVLKKVSEERLLIGISAGSIVLQRDINLVARYSPEMNEGVGLANLTGLSLTDIQLLPHYDRFLTRYERFEERAKEFEENNNCVVYRINDGEAVIDYGNEYEIIRYRENTGGTYSERNITENLDFVEDIKSYTVIEKIAEGYSGDEKYKLEKDGKYFLLRIGDKKNLSEKRKEYERLEAYADKDINTHKPIAFGTADDKFYSIISWVDGTPIMDIIKKDVSKNYYQLGKKVGIELQKLHSCCPYNSKNDWQGIIEKKADLFFKNYHSLNIDFACSKYVEQYILENFNLTKNRPQAVLHGDFHWNNCVEDEAGNVGIIDFSGNDIGDPWYDFGGLLWALEYSESFANGQIDGYFGTPPDEFWKVFKFYTALYAFEHLTYSNGTSEDIKHRILNAGRMLGIFGDDFELEIPIFRK